MGVAEYTAPSPAPASPPLCLGSSSHFGSVFQDGKATGKPCLSPEQRPRVLLALGALDGHLIISCITGSTQALQMEAASLLGYVEFFLQWGQASLTG